MSTVYQPGVCNIGPAEIRSRRRAGIGGTIVTVLTVAAFVVFGVPDGWRWLVAIPAGVAAMGFLQSAFRFCARFGMAGLFNFGDLGTEEAVHETEYRRADQRKAVLISVLSLAIGILVAIIAVVLP
ncbi:hypothetical protein BH10ACT7_BH10ACT7_27050 [soil metagenome]